MEVKGLLGTDVSDLNSRKHFSDYTERLDWQFDSRFTTFEITFDAKKVNELWYQENESEELDVD